MSKATQRRLVLLARHLGAAPSRAQLRRAVRIVEADADLSEVLWAAAEDASGVLWRGVVDTVDAAGLAGCALGLLDLLVELGRDGGSDA